MIKFVANFDLGKEYDQMFDALESELHVLGGDIRRRIVSIIKKSGKVASRDLIDSIEEEVRGDIFQVVLSVGPNSDAPHAIFVEEDTKPHWAPIAPLKKWARVKFGVVGREKDSIAHAVQWKISREGTKGIHFMDQAFIFYERLIEPRVNAIISKHFIN